MTRSVPVGYFEVESARRGECYLTRSVRYPGYHMVIPYPGQRFNLVEHRSCIPMFKIHLDERRIAVVVIYYKTLPEGIPQRHQGNPEEALRQKIGTCVVRVLEGLTHLLPKESKNDGESWEELSKQLNNQAASRLFNERIAALEWLDFNIFPIEHTMSLPNSAEGLVPRLPDQTGGLK